MSCNASKHSPLLSSPVEPREVAITIPTLHMTIEGTGHAKRLILAPALPRKHLLHCQNANEKLQTRSPTPAKPCPFSAAKFHLIYVFLELALAVSV